MLPCHTGGAGEKVAGVLRWTKKVSRSVIGKKKRKEKRKTANREKTKFVREKEKGVKKVKGINSMNKEKRMLFVEKKREEEERKNK